MANIVNNMGQVLLGFRSPVVTPVTSTLLTSLFGVWNADTSTTVTTLNTSVYAAWNAENNTTDSVGGYNGTINGGVTYTTGKLGTYSFSFDGSSGYVSLPQSALNFNKGNTNGNSIGDFSVSFWVNLNSGGASYQTFISNWNDSGYGWQIILNNGQFFFFGSDGSNGATARVQLPIGLSQANAVNQWTHIAVSFTNQSVSKSYVNGCLVNSVSTTYSILTSGINNGRLGVWQRNISTSSWYLNGKLDGITLWNRALTDAEASALYNNGNGYQYSFPSTATGYLTSINDAYGTNNATLMNGAVFAGGKIGQAFTFDGVNDYVALPNNCLNFATLTTSGNTVTGITGQPYSLSLWVYLSDVTSYQSILGNFDSTGGIGYKYGWQLYAYQGAIYFQEGYNTTSASVASGTVSTNTWYNVTVVRNYTGTTPVNIQIYVNGSLANTTSATNYIRYSTLPAMPCIGADKWATNAAQDYIKVNSKIDALAVWNKALTSTEVTALYNSGNGEQYPNY